MLDAVSWPPHVFVIDAGKAWETGDGTLENIPRPWRAESRTSSEEPAPEKIPVGAHILSPTITLLELAGKDVVSETPEAAVLVVNA